MIAPKDLAKVTCVSVAAISQWMKPMVEKGVLIWCGESGDEFSDITSLEKAKRSGKAFIKVAGFSCLPTPFELLGIQLGILKENYTDNMISGSKALTQMSWI